MEMYERHQQCMAVQAASDPSERSFNIDRSWANLMIINKAQEDYVASALAVLTYQIESKQLHQVSMSA